jgi:PPOX class probable F420-dependent enzyme
MTSLTEEQARLLLEPNFGVLATRRPDGSPQATAVWVDFDGEHPLINTVAGRSKERYLRRDPRAALVVFDRENPYRSVALTGEIELVEDGTGDHFERIATKYLGEAGYDRPPPDEQRVTGRMTVFRVSTHGF